MSQCFEEEISLKHLMSYSLTWRHCPQLPTFSCGTSISNIRSLVVFVGTSPIGFCSQVFWGLVPWVGALKAGTLDVQPTTSGQNWELGFPSQLFGTVPGMGLMTRMYLSHSCQVSNGYFLINLRCWSHSAGSWISLREFLHVQLYIQCVPSR